MTHFRSQRLDRRGNIVPQKENTNMTPKEITETAHKALSQGETPFNVRSLVNREFNGPSYSFLDGPERAKLVVRAFEDLGITGENEVNVLSTAETEILKAQMSELERLRALVSDSTKKLNAEIDAMNAARTNIPPVPTLQPGTTLDTTGQPK